MGGSVWVNNSRPGMLNSTHVLGLLHTFQRQPVKPLRFMKVPEIRGGLGRTPGEGGAPKLKEFRTTSTSLLPVSQKSMAIRVFPQSMFHGTWRASWPTAPNRRLCPPATKRAAPNFYISSRMARPPRPGGVRM